MKLLASLAFVSATLVATTFGLASPAMAHDDGDDVTVGVRLGPLCVGLCVGGGGDYDGDDRGDYDYDDDDGFYAYREDFYHQRYDRRDSYDAYRDDGYAGYRRAGHHGGGKHHKRHHDDDGDDGDGDGDDD